MIEAFAIEQMYRERQAERGPELTRWKEVNLQYEGATIVPVSELDKSEKSMAVNLLGPGLDQLAMRIASTMPDISCDPLRPGIQKSENLADLKRRALLSYWDMNRMDMIMRRRARFLLGYSSAPVSISFVGLNPLDKRDMPHWRVINPMCSFPAPMLDVNDIEPSDCIHATQRPLRWLESTYPDQTRVLYKGKAFGMDTMFEILEYNDENETVLIALGQSKEASQRSYTPGASVESSGTQSCVELTRVDNRAGMPLTVYPGRITLAGTQGMFDQLMPIYHNASKLAALEYISIKQSVFANEWLVSHPNSPGQAQIITRADGLTGVMGEIRNGQIQTTQTQPSIQAAQMQDRLERTGRLAGGIPAELNGESATNIRTARRGEAVLGAAIDMPVQEHQEIFEDSMEAENHRAIAVMKGYFGSKPTSFYIPKNGKIDPKKVDYTPNEVFENDQNVVKYGMTGTDANSFVIAMGQRLQMETISPETFMEMDPVVEDVQQEMSRIYISGARRAMMASIENPQQPLDPTFVARFARALQDGKTQPEDALITVHEEMQKEQAAQQAQQPQPGQPPTPATQPGMAGQPPGAIPTPPQSQGALAQILGNLRKPAQQSPSETAMASSAPSPLAQ